MPPILARASVAIFLLLALIAHVHALTPSRRSRDELLCLGAQIAALSLASHPEIHRAAEPGTRAAVAAWRRGRGAWSSSGRVG